MCSGSKSKGCSDGLGTEGATAELHNQKNCAPNYSILLELSASNDVAGFKGAVEEGGYDVNGLGLWYGRTIASKKMRYEERTPLMIASMFGSKEVLKYILEKGSVDVNRACGSDGATALHCAVLGGSPALPEVLKLLVDSSADVNSLDASGNRPADLICQMEKSGFSLRSMLEHILNGRGTGIGRHALIDHNIAEQAEEQALTPSSKDGIDKKEYPVDPSLPDIKNGIYGTDEFRMYTFKVKPCSRAYSHDWTECPFVHPGENARRRDPRKYHYSCVPCPDFRKGACQQGDACEYAHGIFECWLHPAQYRTRMCKDEASCTRRVCFFAHKPEELRPLYASTGSAVPSPRSFSSGASLDLAPISPLTLGSPSVMIPAPSTPPLTPSGSPSPMGGSAWLNQSNLVLPGLQLPGNRLKTAISARDVDVDAVLLGLESHHFRQEQMIDDLSGVSLPSRWNHTLAKASFAASSDRNRELGRHTGVPSTNLDDVFGTLDPVILSQLEGLPHDDAANQIQSAKGIQMPQNMSELFYSSFPSSVSSSSMRTLSSFAVGASGAAASILSSRSAAFAKRSQSFIDRSAVNHHTGACSPVSSGKLMPKTLADWGSPDGKLDWGLQKDELNKLRKSASFGLRSSGSNFGASVAPRSTNFNKPDISWIQSSAKDGGATRPNQFSFEDHHHQQYHLSSRGPEMHPAWVEQPYMDQEQIMA